MLHTHIHWFITGVQLFGSELGNLFYPSNDLDPHLKDGDASLSVRALSIVFSISILVYDVGANCCRMVMMMIRKSSRT